MQWITAIFSLLVSALVAIVRIRSIEDGKKSEKLKTAETTLETVEKSKAASERVSSDIDAKLHERYPDP